MGGRRYTRRKKEDQQAERTPRAKFYGRMSTDSDQQAESIDQQRDDCMLLIQRKGWELKGEYTDPAISGWKEREGLNSLLDDVTSGEVDVIVVYHIDRLTRFEPIDAIKRIAFPLFVNKCKIECATGQSFDFSEFGDLITFCVVAGQAHEQSDKQGKSAYRGQLAKAKKGLHVQGALPYALDLDAEGRYKLGDRRQVASMRLMGKLYLAGDSDESIAAALDAKGYESPGLLKWNNRREGSKMKKPESSWRGEAVHDKLTDPVYAGTFIWGGRTLAKFANVQEKPEIKEQNHPAVFDAKTWAALQAERERRRANRNFDTSPRKGVDAFLFTSLVQCGGCGRPMHGYEDRAPKVPVKRYRCVSCKGRGVKCEGNSISESLLLLYVSHALEMYFCNETSIDRLRESMRRRVLPKGRKTTPKAIRSQLGASQRHKAELLQTLMAVGRIDDAQLRDETVGRIEAELLTVRERIDALQESLDAASTPVAQLEERIESAIAESQKAYADLSGAIAEGRPEARDLMRRVIKRHGITLHSKRDGREYVLEKGVIDITQDLPGTSGSGLEVISITFTRLYCSTREAERILGVSGATFNRWKRAGKVTPVQGGGHGQRTAYLMSDIETLAAERGTA
jgi:site-specific DNA recombinase